MVINEVRTTRNAAGCAQINFKARADPDRRYMPEQVPYLSYLSTVLRSVLSSFVLVSKVQRSIEATLRNLPLFVVVRVV